jgi:hypothetical protein
MNDSRFFPSLITFAILTFLLYACSAPPNPTDASNPTVEFLLPSWKDGATKTAIQDFLKRVTDDNNDAFLSIEDRIAVFDLDGTLMYEKPTATIGLFALYSMDSTTRCKALYDLLNRKRKKANKNTAPCSSSAYYNTVQPFMLAPYLDISDADYQAKVNTFFEAEKHPAFESATYSQLFYRPMLDLIQLLDKHDFDVYILSYSLQSYVRVVGGNYIVLNTDSTAEKAKTLDAAHSMGFIGALKSEFNKNTSKKGDLTAPYETTFLHDTGIVISTAVDLDTTAMQSDLLSKADLLHYRFGKAPALTAGNMRVDVSMFRYTYHSDTSLAKNKHLILLVNHDDAEREILYPGANKYIDTNPDTNELVRYVRDDLKGTVISMKKDFAQVFDGPISKPINITLKDLCLKYNCACCLPVPSE